MRFTPPVDLSAYRGYIFDCDGTLVDTMPLHFRAWKEALLAGGARFEFTWDVFVSRAGMSMEKTVLELSDQFRQALDPVAISAHQRRAFAELEGQVAPVSEVVAFAKTLHGSFPLAVASGSSRRSVEASLAAVGIQRLFDVIITPEDVEHGKPAPDMFLLAAKRMSVAPELCLVIEDGALGIEAARRARMACAIVRTQAPA